MRARWFPTEGESIYDIAKIAAGDVIAVDYHGFRHKPWRVYEIRRRDEDWFDVILRPVGVEFDFAQYNQTIGIRRHAPVYWLPEHYGLCHQCRELNPCSESWAAKISGAVAEQSARFEVEGVCPSCQEPVTRRQSVHRFEENMRVPLGPPVTFHARQRCVGGAIQYDEAVAKATGRDPRLSCAGVLTRHRDHFEVCTNITCPGLSVRHRGFAMCYVLSAKCNRPECWEVAS